MSRALSRRGLVQGGAAVLGAAVAGIPASVQAGISDPDAPLFAALARYHEAWAAWVATDAPLDEALDRAHAAYPPRPRALSATCADVFANLTPTGREMRPDGTMRRFYVQDDVARLRDMGPITRVQWLRGAHPPAPVLCPDHEARRQEVISAFDAWTAACAVVDEAAGLIDAGRANEEACAVLNEAEDAIERLSARTPAGLVAKARWAVLAFEDGGSIDTLEQFVRQVAAFGEVAS